MSVDVEAILRSTNRGLGQAVEQFWATRRVQETKQRTGGRKDQGSRSAVTGGHQMDGFIRLITELLVNAGIDDNHIYYNRRLELPGFFRPTKLWDVLVVREGQLIAAIEAKSQVGPSFGNNFNNRTEEAMGSALDLWTAFREGAFNSSIRPWLGYVFLLEDCERSRQPVSVNEPHFPVFEEFKNASYGRRYECFCRRLARERLYSATSLILSPSGKTGQYTEPAADLKFLLFARSLLAHALAFGQVGLEL